MEYSRINKIGVEISKVSLGTLVLKDKIFSSTLFGYALDNGINYFDTSDGYLGGESEIILGEILSNYKRDTYLLGSKAYFSKGESVLQQGLNKKNIFHSVENSLRKLKTDYLDIFYCHRFDVHTPIEETLDAIHQLMHQGKILHWGVCGYSVFQLCETYYQAKQRLISLPAVAQYAYNLYNRSIELELQEALCKLDIGVIGYYPLAQGILTGKYTQGVPSDSRASVIEFKKSMWDFTPEKILQSSRFKDFAESKGYTPASLALFWCLKNKNIKSVITNASSLEQFDDNLKFHQINLVEDELIELEKIFNNQPVNPYTGLKF